MKVKFVVALISAIISTSSMAAEDVVIISPHAIAGTCNAGNRCAYAGYQDISITNNGDTNFYYNVTYSLYADHEESREGGGYTIKPHETFTYHHVSKLVAKINLRGNWPLTSSVYIVGRKVYQSSQNNNITVI